MDLAKLQVEAFKNIVVRKGVVGYANLTDVRVAITPDGFTVFAIPEIDLFIDRTKMVETPILRNMFDKVPGSVEVIGTVSKCIYKGGLGSPYLVKIYSADNPQVCAYCNKSYYDKYNSDLYTAHITDNRTAIRFFNDTTGAVNHVILPVYVRQEKTENAT